MKYFIIAGEASGDLHASNLIREIKSLDSNAVFQGMGGELMRKQGCSLVQDYRNMAFMGFVAVLFNLKAIRRNFQIAHQAIMNFRPDHLILIDYPSFNLKIAKFAKQHIANIKITYYIPPKAWAWKKWRVHKIAQYSDKILGIFPFEPEFYKSYGYNAEYVGNPTVESIDRFIHANAHIEKTKSIVLVPGSRPHEVEKCLPKMLLAVEKYADEYEINITQAPALDSPIYERIISKTLKGRYHPNLCLDTYLTVTKAAVAVVNSGTATLETALLRIPQVAVYHIAFPHIAGLIWKLVFTIRHFTLVNIIAGKEVIKELLAYLFTVKNIQTELDKLLLDSEYRAKMLDEYERIEEKLGHNRTAEEAAKIICNK